MSTRGFCLIRSVGSLPAFTAPANGGLKLGVEVNPGTVNLAADAVNKWWSSPDETKYLYIAHTVGSTVPGSNIQPIQPGIAPAPDSPNAGVGFWAIATLDRTDTGAYIALGNAAWFAFNGAPGVFTADVQVRDWVIANNLWDNYLGPANSSTPETPLST